MITARLVTAFALAAGIVSAPAISRADTVCTDDTSCAGDTYCSPAGSCVARSPSGAACNEDDACSAKICGADHVCGATDGEPACTPSSGAVICRSGNCSASGVCVPQAGDCYLDSDCTNVQFCNRTTYQCTAVLPDGAALPNDGLHDQCVAGDPNDACASGSCNPGSKTCGSVSAAVKPSTSATSPSASSLDGGADSGAGPSITVIDVADSGVDAAAIEEAIEKHIESEIPGLSCSAAPSPVDGSKPVSHGGMIDFLALIGGLALFRKVTSRGIASSRTDRRRSPAA